MTFTQLHVYIPELFLTQLIYFKICTIVFSIKSPNPRKNNYYESHTIQVIHKSYQHKCLKTKYSKTKREF